MSQPKESQFRLKIVNSKNLNLLKQFGLLEDDTRQVAKRLLEISLKPDDLRDVCMAIFDEDFSDTDFAELDSSKFVNGFNRFLLQFWGASSVLPKSGKN